jgi:hypothetical protein
MAARALMAIVLLLLGATGAQAAVTIAFYAHHLGSKGLWVEFPHAYVTLTGTTEVGALPVKANFGFTPPVVGPDALFGWVDGAVVGADDDYVAKDTPYLTFALTDKQYATVLAVAARYRNYPQPSYEIDKRNCVLFVKDVAAALGLSVSDDERFVREPGQFMADLKTRNAETVARIGVRPTRTIASYGQTPAAGMVDSPPR